MSSLPWRAALMLSFLAVLPRCAKDPTGFYVTVNVPRGVGFLHISVLNPAALTAMPTMGDPPMPPIAAQPALAVTGTSMSFVIQGSGRYPQVTIEVQGSLTAARPMGVAPVAYDRATVTYVDDAMLKVPMTLQPPCMGGAGALMPCPGTQHCVNGSCAPSENRNLSRYNW